MVNLKVAGPSLRLKHLEIFRCMRLESLEGNEEIPQGLEFTSLKHLILNITVGGYNDRSLLGFTSLLEAAPSLRKFTLQLLSFRPSMIRVPKVLTPCPHKCLEVVEMIGFTGGTTDLELFTYLIQNAINLEKVIFDPYHPFKGSCEKEKDEARKRAHEFGKRLPPRVNSVVL
ncbi:hypothetical protein RHMOL_Rhmol08G0243800 [Rhododendron molle]|uniref:Uncharacterized protein n=1 Tax=Rhododendron molle TaxID=49168 RepID=A0ACC0MTC0_RHOML|nr:hypothetical protein RHMOL_Rhmol08G0243800 [Rhododendron molle]